MQCRINNNNTTSYINKQYSRLIGSRVGMAAVHNFSIIRKRISLNYVLRVSDFYYVGVVPYVTLCNVESATLVISCSVNMNNSNR